MTLTIREGVPWGSEWLTYVGAVRYTCVQETIHEATMNLWNGLSAIVQHVETINEFAKNIDK